MKHADFGLGRSRHGTSQHGRQARAGGRAEREGTRGRVGAEAVRQGRDRGRDRGRSNAAGTMEWY